MLDSLTFLDKVWIGAFVFGVFYLLHKIYENTQRILAKLDRIEYPGRYQD